MSNDWHIQAETGAERTAESRSEAEQIRDDMEALGVDVEIVPPGSDNGAVQVVDGEGEDAQDAYDLPERSVGEDPLTWIPSDFVDEIDGSQAINRRGFEVLSHFYDISVYSDIQVAPEDTGFEFCRVKAKAVTPDGRECEAFGSAHTDRGDDAEILLEMADTRARKRSLSIATGVGACAVEELRNELEDDADG